MISDEIERLAQLRNSGALSEEEFQQAKRRVLNGAGAPGAAGGPGFQSTEPPNVFAQPHGWAANGPAPAQRICGVTPDVWSALLHLSQLLTWTGVGIVAPIVMWIVGREESPSVNRHGLMVMNWMISSLVYAIISGLAIFVVIGIPMLIVLGALNIVFPIIGALKAADGQAWKYPLTIEFLRVPEQAV